MSIKRMIWVIVIIVAIVLLALPKLMQPNKNTGAGKPSGKGTPVNVSVKVVEEKTTSESVLVSGNIMAMEEVELHPEISGRVVKIAFNEGSKVTKGQLLVKINDSELKAQLKRANATRQLKAETEARNKNLLNSGAVSKEAYDQSLSESNGADADVELIQEQIRKTEIIAPFSGMIGLRYISEGSYVTSNSQVASLHTIDQVKIEFPVPEKYAPSLKKGDPITFTIDGNNEIFKANIFAIEPRVDAATRNVMMRAVCDNHSGILFPGAFASVSIPLGQQKKVLMIPTQAVVPVLKGQKVFIVQGDSAVERMIKTGTRGDVEIEVKEGLNAGDVVIVNGVMYVRNGTKVKIK